MCKEYDAYGNEMDKGKIHFHGTNEENANKILKEGFNQYTYFTPFLDAAINFGGDYVFGVFFKEKQSTGWQWICKERIPPERIWWLKKYQLVEELYHNKDADREYSIHWKNKYYGEEYPFCERCNGRGQLDDANIFKGKSITVCPDCHGYGILGWRDRREKIQQSFNF